MGLVHPCGWCCSLYLGRTFHWFYSHPWHACLISHLSPDFLLHLFAFSQPDGEPRTLAGSNPISLYTRYHTNHLVSFYHNMYKPRFNKRQVLVFRQFGNKGYSLFSCLGREVVCSVLSVATLTYASAESVSTHPVVTDSTAMTTAREMQLEEVSIDTSCRDRLHRHDNSTRDATRGGQYNWLEGAPDEKSGSENGHCTGTHRYCAGSCTKY